VDRYGSGSRLYFWLVLIGDILAMAAVIFIGVALLILGGVIPRGGPWPTP